MRVALQYGSVHECARVTLICVTADVFLVSFILLGQFPFETGWESAAAASAQAGVDQALDDIVRSHLGKDLAQGLIAAGSDVLFNDFRVDDAAVTQGNAVLFFVEICVDEGLDAGWSNGLLIEKTSNDTSL